ncbi:MAG: phosphotransferase [Vicinamibacterales bacterium]
MSHSGDVFDPILTVLAANKSGDFGASGARVERLRRIDGPYSSVQHVRIRTPTRTTFAYIKVLMPRRPGQEGLAQVDRMLKREYLATQALHEALQQDRNTGAVRPLAWLPEHRALVTEEVSGRPLAELLDDSHHSADELAAILARVGGWIRMYQKVVDATGVIDLAERRVYVDDRLALLEGRVLSAADRQATLDRFDALVAEIGTPAVPAVAIHADLNPLNVIVDERGRTTVLDFTMAKTGTVYNDLTHLYFHLGLKAARYPARRPEIHALQQALMAGYAPTVSVEEPLFRLMLLQHGVCHVTYLAERHLPVVDAAYRWFMRRRWRACERMPVRAGGPQVA